MDSSTRSTSEQPEWLRKKFAGVVEGSKKSIVCDGKYYAIVKTPGGSYWSGRGMQGYAKTCFDLVKKVGGYGDVRGLLEGRMLLRHTQMFKDIVRAADDLEELILRMKG